MRNEDEMKRITLGKNKLYNSALMLESFFTNFRFIAITSHHDGLQTNTKASLCIIISGFWWKRIWVYVSTSLLIYLWLIQCCVKSFRLSHILGWFSRSLWPVWLIFHPNINWLSLKITMYAYQLTLYIFQDYCTAVASHIMYQVSINYPRERKY